MLSPSAKPSALILTERGCFRKRTLDIIVSSYASFHDLRHVQEKKKIWSISYGTHVSHMILVDGSKDFNHIMQTLTENQI